jgi:DNA-directed RNA polymerase sigma subunit (sigma70/sigma32)
MYDDAAEHQTRGASKEVRAMTNTFEHKTWTAEEEITAGLGGDVQDWEHLVAVEAPQTSSAQPMDPQERDRLLVEHLPTVRFIARKIHGRLPQHVELDDLISAGVVGLIDAFGKFDHSKQVQFKSYAQFRVRGAILDSLRMLDWSPRELRRRVAR